MYLCVHVYGCMYVYIHIKHIHTYVLADLTEIRALKSVGLKPSTRYELLNGNSSYITEPQNVDLSMTLVP
jgi:hypothetical protein